MANAYRTHLVRQIKFILRFPPFGGDTGIATVPALGGELDITRTKGGRLIIKAFCQPVEREFRIHTMRTRDLKAIRDDLFLSYAKCKYTYDRAYM